MKVITFERVLIKPTHSKKYKNIDASLLYLRPNCVSISTNNLWALLKIRNQAADYGTKLK